MNLSDAPHTLYKVARIGEVYPVTSLKQAHEMLQVNPHLSDWDSRLDGGQLLDARMAANTSVGTGKKIPCRNRCMDAGLDPKELQEYLQPLMEWIAEDITTREWEELAVAISEYRDVFSSRPALGITDQYAWHPGVFRSPNKIPPTLIRLLSLHDKGSFSLPQCRLACVMHHQHLNELSLGLTRRFV